VFRARCRCIVVGIRHDEDGEDGQDMPDARCMSGFRGRGRTSYFSTSKKEV
jgi:hypothetical protein